MDFRIITPAIYWTLIILWTFVFVFYAQRLFRKNTTDKFFRLLLIILAIDAFRTLFESMYFGAWYTSLTEIIPLYVYEFLAQPKIVFFPKLINLIASLLILFMIIRKWLPEETNRIEILNKLLTEKTKEIEAENIVLQSEAQTAKENEEKYRKATTNSPFPIMIYADDGEVILINKTWTNITGYGLNEINTITKWTEKAYGKKSTLLKEYIDKLYLLGESIEEGEFTIITKTGEERIWDFSSAPLDFHEDGRRMVISSAVDVTEKKKTANDLAESNEYNRALFEQTQIGLALTSMDGKLVDVNAAFAAIMGYTIEEVLPLSYWDITPEKYTEQEKTQLELLKTNNRYGPYEKEYIHKDGHLVPVRLQGKLITRKGINYIWSSVEDITEQKQAEELLLKSENSVRTKLNAIMLPEGNLDVLLLEEILDVPAVSRIMENIFNLTGIAVALGDLNGKALVAFGWQDVCTQFHRAHPASCKNCTESDTVLASQVEPGKYKQYKCKNNLWDLSIPIHVSSRHVGNIFIGQFFYKDEVPDLSLFEAQAKLYGFNEAEYLMALERVPRVSKETVNALTGFYSQFSAMISRLSYSSIRFARVINEQKKVEEVLRESQTFNQTLLDISPDLIYVYDLVESKNIYSNLGIVKILGYSIEEIQKMGDRLLPDLMHPDDFNYYLDSIIPQYQTTKDGDIIGNEYRMKRKNGTWCWLRSKETIFMRQTDGSAKQIFGITSDITSHKNTETEIINYRDHLEDIVKERTESLAQSQEALLNLVDDLNIQSAALEKSNLQLGSVNQELESFSYSVSHDLRAPLRGIDGFSQALLEDYNEILDEQGKNYLTRVRKGTQKMALLIDEMLNLSRLTRKVLNPQKVNLSAIVESICEEIQANDQERVVAFVIEPDLYCMADSTLISAALQNLLENAWKFSTKKASSKIEFGKLDFEGKMTYFVRDNGAGFNDKYADKLFTPFQRLHQSSEFPGTGVGLTTVQRIIHRHQGVLWATSKVDEGATFYFTLKS